jgi:hypothetical protein
MSISLADLKRLKASLKRDLDAVEHVEALLAREDANSTHIPRTVRSRAAATKPSNAGLTDAVVNILKHSPLRPSGLIKPLADKGYKFDSPKKALSSISTVLAPGGSKGIEKLPDGTYTCKK